MTYVYLLHFDERLDQFQHYVGSCEDLSVRLDQHARGRGAQLTTRFSRAGIGFVIGGLWEHETLTEGRQGELFIKRNIAGKCCICRTVKKAEKRAKLEKSA